MSRLEKEEVLERIYYDVDGGFGSVRDLYKKASRCRHNFGYGFYMDAGATQQANKKLQELQCLHCTVPEV